LASGSELKGKQRIPKYSRGPSDDCRAACLNLNVQHDGLCVAIANEEDAKEFANTLSVIAAALLAGAVTIVAAALGAAALFTAIANIVGAVVATALLVGGAIAATVALAAGFAVLVAAITAQIVATQKAAKTSEIRNEKLQALANVRDVCGDDAQNCIDNLTPST